MEKFVELKEYITDKCLKYHIVTYGCQMNEHESEKLGGMLEELGFAQSQQLEAADFILFNTCCIRDNAEQKTFGNVGALKHMKEENPHLLIGVCGCMTQQREVAKKLYKIFPFVDIIFGTHNISELPALLDERIVGRQRVLDVWDSEGEIHEDVPIKRGRGPLASVNIMYGCNNFCSYCIVPYVRGRERSRDAATIAGEVQALADEGYREIMLLGQNVNSYRNGDTGFPELLEMICGRTTIERIRFMTSHPKDLSDGLIGVMKNNPQVCKHIHLPVQSGSNNVLKMMNRGYTREQYLALADKLRAAMPGIAITSDLIVGFPGEGDQDFEDTLSLVRTVRFDSAFTFVFSKRSGTTAAKMSGEVAPDIQRERIMKLIEVQNAITEEKNRLHVGKGERVLVEGLSTRDSRHICGRTDGGKMVNFEGTEQMAGKLCDVRITQAKRTTLFGEMI